VLSVTVVRPVCQSQSPAHACKRSPSVRLLRRFQFCKSGPISLRGLDRFTFAKRGKWAADIFTQHSNRPSRPFIHRSLQGYRHAGLPTSCHCGLCECFAGGTAVLGFKNVNITPMFVKDGFLGSRMSTSLRCSARTARLGDGVQLRKSTEGNLAVNFVEGFFDLVAGRPCRGRCSCRRATLSAGTSARTRSSPRLRADRNTVQ
jgi:hypothetical protein